eukprot:g42060.t1
MCWTSDVETLASYCFSDLEYLTLKCHPYHLLCEFTSAILTVVYIPAHADLKSALDEVYNASNSVETECPEALLIIASDFNQANLKNVLPKYYQQISCPNRGLNILDHCYTTKDADHSNPCPCFGKSNDNTVLLLPAYKQKLKSEDPSTDWSIFKNLAAKLNKYATIITDFISNWVPKMLIRMFCSQKPWMNQEIHCLLKSRSEVFKLGNSDLYRKSSKMKELVIDFRKRMEGTPLSALMVSSRPKYRQCWTRRPRTDPSASHRTQEDINPTTTRNRIGSNSDLTHWTSDRPETGISATPRRADRPRGPRQTRTDSLPCRSIRLGTLTPRTVRVQEIDKEMGKRCWPEAENLDEYGTTITDFISKYRTKLEAQTYQRDSYRLWRGLNDITGYKMKQCKMADNDTSLPETAMFSIFGLCRIPPAWRCLPPTAPDTCVPSVTALKVRSVFLGVSSRKARGPGGVPSRALGSCVDQLVVVFTDIFNLSLPETEVPTCFKKTTIIPIPKKTHT